jgi:hypothetical protein
MLRFFLDNFRLKIPAEMYRLAGVGVVASLLATAVIYSRGENVGAEVTEQRAKFQQPKDREQAEGWFIPAPKDLYLSEENAEEVATAFSAVPLPKPRPNTPGFYYELLRAQGDADEGEYELIERKCIPAFDMPKPCYLPERVRRNFPLRR